MYWLIWIRFSPFEESSITGHSPEVLPAKNGLVSITTMRSHAGSFRQNISIFYIKRQGKWVEKFVKMLSFDWVGRSACLPSIDSRQAEDSWWSVGYISIKSFPMTFVHQELTLSPNRQIFHYRFIPWVPAGCDTERSIEVCLQDVKLSCFQVWEYYQTWWSNLLN